MLPKKEWAVPRASMLPSPERQIELFPSREKAPKPEPVGRDKGIEMDMGLWQRPCGCGF